MNSTDSLRDFESDFESLCGIVELTHGYPCVTDIIEKIIIIIIITREKKIYQLLKNDEFCNTHLKYS